MILARRHWIALAVIGLSALLLALWVSRAMLAETLANRYFREHGIRSSVTIGALGLSGASARFALGPADAPDIAAEQLELRFDPLSFIPRVVEVRLVNPVIRAAVQSDGRITLGSLQGWIDSLAREKGKSRFVSDDLTVALTGLRALLATPGGPVEIGGDVRLVRNLPVSAALRARPGALAWRDIRATVRAASLTYDSSGGALAVRFIGDLQTPKAAAQAVQADVTARGLHWESRDGALHVTAPNLRLQLAAARITAGVAANTVKADVTARNLAVVLGARRDLRADLAITASGEMPPEAIKAVRAADPVLGAALAANLASVTLEAGAQVEMKGETLALSFAPSQVKGARGAVLRLSALALRDFPASPKGRIDVSLIGGGLPSARLAARNFQGGNGRYSADATLSARFGYAMLRGAEFSTDAVLEWRDDTLAVTPQACLRFGLQSFRPGAADMARQVRASLCPLRGQPLLTVKGADWTFNGMARGASAILPLPDAAVSDAAAQLSFAGHGEDFSGTAKITGARLSDRAPGPRFHPLLADGDATLAAGVWKGRFALSSEKKHPVADVTFNHVMATGGGAAHIAAPALVFAPEQLQPVDLSPLLAVFRRAEGKVAFTGDLSWTRAAILSNGRLDVGGLDFLSPMGRARAVKTQMVFTSLLPPITADNQEVTVSRIEWTLPFSGVDLRFGFNPTNVKVGAVSSGWAEGRAALGSFTVNLANPKAISGAAQLSGISLAALVSASNLGGRVKMEGKVSGTVPFTSGPEGIRITNGRIAADGPGRLAIDRTLWTKGEPSANAVQDFAYQALENMAFDSLTADLNSVANGRLQIVFHIKGKSDPPKAQTADVAISDIVNGTALQKAVPLPSGTPIDLTLDASLNFDELLKSYAEAWSNTLNP